MGPLGEKVKKLADNWKIKTYAIGFNLEGGAGAKQLAAIAQHGGTGMDKHINATNLDSLTTAFDTIFENINPRDCSGAEIVINPPTCTDLDSDGWCSDLDCNEANSSINPAGLEIDDNTYDENCDGYDKAWANIDQDGDGYTPNQGDCNDFQKLVGPGSIEVAGDGIDNNCNQKTDEAFISCDSGLTLAKNDVPGNALKLAKAMGICSEKGLLSSTLSLAGESVTEKFYYSSSWHSRASLSLPYFDDTYQTYQIKTGFGTNIIKKEGSNLAILSTGDWDKPTMKAYTTNLADGDMRTASKVPTDWINKQPNCKSPESSSCGGTTATGTENNTCSGKEIPSVQDPVMLTVTIKVPNNAKSFSFNSYFFSVEFPQTACNVYNDFFIVLLDSQYNEINPLSSDLNPYDKNLAMDINRNPIGVDLAPDGLFKACSTSSSDYPDAENDYSEFCDGMTELLGTGFDTAGSKKHGGTGWLNTKGNVVPGETITLRIAVWEEGNLNDYGFEGPDHSYDTTVLLDNFQWGTEEVTPGTEPV